MSENNSTQPKHYLLYTLVILLVGIVGFQTWYLMSMKHHMDVIQGIVSSENTDTMNNAAATQIARTIDKNQSLSSPTNSTAAKDPSVSQQIQNGLNAQIQPDQQGRPIPADPPSLFDDDFFNQPFAGSNWNPYEEIERMQRHMDRVFNNAFSRFNSSPDFQHIFKESSASPQMKVKEDDSKYTVTVNLPGADEKNISVNLDGQQLTVSGKQDTSQQKKDAMGNVIFQQRHSGSFQRSITLAEPVKENGMVTHVDDGVLTITVPKAG